MSEPTAPEGAESVPAVPEEEVVPDYSRVGFKGLRALCKDRRLPADGSVVDLIEKLKAYDAQHGRDVDLTAAENLPEEEEVDLLADDDEPNTPQDNATPERPDGGGEAASTPPPPGYSHTLPEGGSMTSAAPAVFVFTNPDEPKRLPSATLRGGRPDLTVREGAVRVGEGHGAAEVRAYRHEIPIGPRDVSDADHFAYIAEAHAAAHAAGHLTKGGLTIGERIGYLTDADGRRTVVYQVPLKRQQ